jgi:beta-glucosidase
MQHRGRGMIAGAALLAALAAVAPAQISGQAALWGRQGEGCKARAGETRAWMNATYTAACRARFALDQFHTPEEKLAFLDAPPPIAAAVGEGGPAAATARGVRKVADILALPSAGASDGPAGVVRGVVATAFGSPLGVAASFDTAAAARYGDLMGAEFRAAGHGTILGPAFDITRSWRFGRLSESFGEDPFLTARMAASEVHAIQARNVLVTMKHYAAYGQEAGRVGDAPAGAHPTVDNILSERALREIYLPGFEGAVKQGGAGAVMCSFPRVNGVYACEHPHLFDILKREWGFDGSVGPDFPSAQRSITRAVLAGLDTGSFGPTPFNAALRAEKPLRQAFADGEIPEARLDDLILRRLIPAFRVGLYDNPRKREGDDVSTPATRTASAELVTGGSVLLRNERGILPFGPKVRSIAVIGVQATDKGIVTEQGSPYVKPAHLEPALAAISKRAGAKLSVRFAPGTSGLAPLPAPPAGLFRTARGEPGFTADYFANPNMVFTGAPAASATVDRPYLDKQPAGVTLPANNQWSVRYTGTITPARSGVHKFSLHGSGSARLFIDGKLQGAFELADFGNAIHANVPLVAGQPAEVRIEYAPRAALGAERRPMFGMNMGLTLEFGYAPPDTLIADAAKAARAADVAIVFVGEQVGEGMDRASLSLQSDQDALIEAVARANPNTVVVLNTGGPVAMPWLTRVAAVLEMWLPGDAQGPAAAAMLFGDREPGGRLPVTFPADETQGPATKPHQFPGTRDPQTGALDTAYFDEGIFVGYRYWDQYDQKPLFSFGHGLGYTNFAIDPGTVEPDGKGGAIIRARLRNIGKRAGAEVVQVYLGFPAAAGAPPKQLKGFDKLTLQAGETRDIAIPLSPEAFRFWDEDQAGWRILPGTYQIMVGRSSRDIAWTRPFEIAAAH